MDRLPELMALSNGPPPLSASEQNRGENSDQDNQTPSQSPSFSPRAGGGDDGGSATKGHHEVVFLEPPSEIDQDAADLLLAFFSDAQRIHLIINYIEDITAALDETHAENMSNLDPDRAVVLRKEIAQRMSEVAVQLNMAKEFLDAMQKGTAALKAEKEVLEANSGVVRIQENFYFYLARQLNSVMAAYQTRQSINQEKYKIQTQRQIKIKFTKPDGSSIDDATAEQLTEQVMENQLTNEIFQQSKNLLASVTETRNDIYRIEQSMRELNQMFNEMAILVNEQGEMMDVILSNLQNTSKYLAKGRRELQRARKYQKKSRKKLYCLLGCGIFLFLLVLVVVLGFMIPK